jgi:hypothetical protein
MNPAALALDSSLSCRLEREGYKLDLRIRREFAGILRPFLYTRLDTDVSMI